MRENPISIFPCDRPHESIDIVASLRPKIERIGMFIHVEGEDRRGSSQGHRVIGRPLNDQPFIAVTPGQEHPALAAPERLSHGRIFLSPARQAAKIPLDGLRKRRARLRGSAQSREIKLVQDH